MQNPFRCASLKESTHSNTDNKKSRARSLSSSVWLHWNMWSLINGLLWPSGLFRCVLEAIQKLIRERVMPDSKTIISGMKWAKMIRINLELSRLSPCGLWIDRDHRKKRRATEDSRVDDNHTPQPTVTLSHTDRVFHLPLPLRLISSHFSAAR